MMKNAFLLVLLFAGFSATAVSEKDSLPPTNTVQLNSDDPELAEIDRILVSSYLNHYCFSTEECVLNAYGYSPETVPTFSDDLVARRMEVLDKNTPFDLVYNGTVQDFINLYAVRRRDISTKVLGMSELYFPMIEEQLAKYGIPLEMKYLAIVESALNPTAISRAGAGGLWQFMVSTGKMYGLEVSSYQDERFDAYKSTDAACRYLKFLYNTFGDWQLALAAYNSGPGNVNKAIRRSGGKRDFWSIKPYLPKETQGYVPAFIAVNYVMNHASEYNIYPKKPLTTFFEIDTIGVTKRVDFNELAKVVNMPVDDIAFLNGTYKLKEIPDNGHKHYLVLPIEKMGLFMANEDAVYAQSAVKRQEPELTATASVAEKTPDGKVANVVWETGWKNHKVKKGESLGTIANKYDVTLAQLRKWNKIKNSKIVPGQTLKVQTKVKKTIYTDAPEEEVAQNNTTPKVQQGSEASEEESYQDEAKAQVTEKVEVNKPQYKYYTVQKGDTLYKIASAKGVSVAQIKNLNHGLKENKLTVGQKIKIKQI
ncbi:MAG: LysM peptidoglycan-binding domain-containing protein [Flavobacteriales bacterium]|nr:LysM peptidoglycan-binding domain-containing protein [Flavobacteriales bacterium]